jgi:hypothetical protein
MTRTNVLYTLGLASILVLGATNSASAERMPMGPNVSIGTVYHIPGAFIAQPPAEGWTIAINTETCPPSPYQTDFVRLVKNTYQDAQLLPWNNAIPMNVTVVSDMTAVCGYQIGPLNLHGYQMRVYASNANDTLINTAVSQVYFHGQAGDDDIWNTFSNSWDMTYGESGNDLFILGQNEFATGEEDSDLFCVIPGVLAGHVNGDGVDWDGGEDSSAGVDGLCGPASRFTWLEWQDPNCSCFD